MNPLIRSALIGAAVGGRSTAGFAALSLFGADPPGWLRTPVGRVLAGTAYLGETIGDKLPNTPSRLTPVGLGSRIAIGAVASLVVDRGSAGNRFNPVSPLVGAAATVAGSFVGNRFRVAAAKHGPRVGFAAAVIEDLTVAATAIFAVTGARGSR